MISIKPPAPAVILHVAVVYAGLPSDNNPNMDSESSTPGPMISDMYLT